MKHLVVAANAVCASLWGCAGSTAVKPVRCADAVSIIADLQEIVAPDGIQRLETVRIGGIEQYVSIRGRDPSNPVLLVLHGGPGWVAMPVSWWANHGWDEYFVVVHWDQRGAGKTYALQAPEAIAPTLTRERMDKDVDEIVTWIRRELDQERIFVLGHSWGSVLGLSLAARHPEWLHAYVGVGQGIDFYESERRGWRWAMDRAVEAGNEAAVRELKAIARYADDGAPIELEDLKAQRKWVNHFGGAAWRRPNAGFESAAFRLSPVYTDDDLTRVFEAQDFSMAHLLSAVLEVDMSTIDRLDIPLFLFLGRHDINVSSEVAAEWFTTVEAPEKTLVWFEQSAHEIMVEEPAKVLVTLVNQVRPHATRGP